MGFYFDPEFEEAVVYVEKWKHGLPPVQPIHEDKSMIDANHLRVNYLDMNKAIKNNPCMKEITNPIIFQGGNVPTKDGLLSNEIFGITRYDRANICAYIDLSEDFLTPHLYKIWSKLDKNIIGVIYGTTRVRIDNGKLVEDPEGDTGLRWLRKNYDKIDILRTTSLRRDENATLIEQMQKKPNEAFINKCFVIPAFYRDVDTSKKGKVAIGELNELYRNLIIAVKSLKDAGEYGLSMGDSVRGRIQGILVQIFDWFGSGTTVGGVTTGAVLPGKIGVIRRAVMNKTTDYADRLVLSAPDLRYNKLEYAMVDMEYSAVPMAATISTFMPFVIFHVKRLFEAMFSGGNLPIIKKDGTVEYKRIKDYQIQFSDEKIKKQINRFIHGFSNRFIPVEVELEDGSKVVPTIKGFYTTVDDFKKGLTPTEQPFNRRMTWCDVLYIAAVRASSDKCIVAVRYPFDSVYNQITTKVHVNSTVVKDQVVIDGEFFPYYPHITDDMIGMNTSNMFIDTLNISNLYLDGIGGDYDGDTMSLKGIYTVEANEELMRVQKAKYNFITSANAPIRKAGHEAIQSLYSLTVCLPSTKRTPTKEIVFG